MPYTRYAPEELKQMLPENLVERLIQAARSVGETDDGSPRPADYTYETSGREMLQLQEEVLRRLGVPLLTEPSGPWSESI